MARNNNNNATNSVDVIALSAYTTPLITVVAKNDWVDYGHDNNHFNELIEYNNGSTTSKSIVNGLSRMIYGSGLKAADDFKKPDEYAAMKSIIKDKELKKIIYDRKLLGMAAMKVSYNNGAVKSIKHWPMETLRAEKADDNGEINNYYWSNDWSLVKPSTEVNSFPAFGKSDSKKDEIYIVKPYVTGEFYYSKPDYSAALPYCLLESQIGDYLINDVKNGFSGSLMINFNNGVPSKDIQNITNRKVMNKFTGAGGSKILFNYNKNAEAATTIERLPLDNAPDHYKYLSDECRDKIIIGHRITSPLLIGVRDTNSGFGSNADEIETSSLLMDKVVVKGFQEELVDAIDEIMAVNNINLDLYFATVVPRDFMEDEEEVEQVDVDKDIQIQELAAEVKKFMDSTTPTEDNNNNVNI